MTQNAQILQGRHLCPSEKSVVKNHSLLGNFHILSVEVKFKAKESVDDFSVAVSYDDIAAKNYSLSAGQYFEVKIEYVDITPEEFQEKQGGHQERLSRLFETSSELEKKINKQLEGLVL